MRLQHLRLVNPITYEYSLRLQEALVERHFASKIIHKNASLTSKADAPPPPTLITFQCQPTYTVGRRHLKTNPLSAAQVAYLTGSTAIAQEHEKDLEIGKPDASIPQPATFYPSPRGGLLTYHAPGQITAYLILNLRSHALTPRCYIRMLENTVIKTCAQHGVPNVMTTEDPGVWIGEQTKESGLEAEPPRGDNNSCAVNNTTHSTRLMPTNRKICAIGVHMSRGITSHGIGFNIFDAPLAQHETGEPAYTMPKNSVYTPSTTYPTSLPEESTIPAPGYLSWGFSRIVACGLEGKSVTWLTKEQGASQKQNSTSAYLETVADTLASEVAHSLKIDYSNIDQISVNDVITPTDRGQKWKFLRSQSGELRDTRAKGDVLQQYRIRDLRGDNLLRII